MKKEREFSLDVIRVVAAFLVITVHFFLHSGYYKLSVDGFDKIIMEAIRILAMTCVPLFLLLTGYLKNNKEINKKYYKGIIPIYIIYVLCCIVEMLFKKYYIGKDISMIMMIKSILNFTGANYAWYVEMYIGLFLLIPFLNVLWNNLKNKKEHQILLITLIVCTVLPSVLNSFNFSPDISDLLLARNGKDQLIPDWWVNLYPIMYYFVGCYLCKYKEELKFDSKKVFLILGCCCIAFSVFNYFRNNGIVFRSESFKYAWYGIEIAVNSVLLFIGIKNISFKKVPKIVDRIITKMSIISFGTYLVSHVFDTIFYKMLCNNVVNVVDRWIYLPLVVCIVFIFSNLVSLVLHYIRDILINLFMVFKKKIKF